jgi:23S rRNA (cytosine1962-C5)-methyltransferase
MTRRQRTSDQAGPPRPPPGRFSRRDPQDDQATPAQRRVAAVPQFAAAEQSRREQAGEPETDLASPPTDLTVAAPRQSPWVRLKYFSFASQLYPAMIREASPDAAPGSLVTVYDKEGRRFGAGLFNPHARVPLRMFHHGETPFTEADFPPLLDRALELRLERLRLPEVTDAFRAVHSDGDGLSGLIVDKFADALSVEVHSLGVWQRLPHWLPRLRERLGTHREVVEVSDLAARLERISRRDLAARPAVPPVKIREHGVRYEVNFAEGHKTGFFCDQRENRLRFARLAGPSTRVLDLCCYTGGFALAAVVLGRAADVTGVDLDETAIAQARRNANLNQARVNWVHCDAFSYARQMRRNARQWDLIVADPPKFVASREEFREGQRRYEDLNGLALTLLKPGGLLVTCSCSGLVSAEDFEQFVCRAAHRQGRRLQILDRTGAGPDHPVMSNCPEGHYLKVLWARVA